MLVSRRSAKLEDPLYGYAVIEVLIGLVGLVFHDLIYVPVTGWAYDSLFPALGGGPRSGIAKWALAGLLILPQSIMLGATFPLMSAGMIRRAPERPGSVLSILYFTNSLGAAAGVLLAGFVLVRMAGLPGTLLAAAILNLVVGLVAFFVAKLQSAQAGGAAASGPERLLPLRERCLADRAAAAHAAPAHGRARHRDRVVRLRGGLDPAAVAGAGQRHAFVRADALGLHPGTVARARSGSGGGWRRWLRPLATLVTIQMVMGGFALLSLAFYQQSFQWTADLLAAVGRTDQGYFVFTLARYGLCLVIMLPATFCAGMTLPLITRTLFVSGAGEAAIGRVYSWNTFGSIIGAALASLLLIPLLGLKGALILGGVMDMVVGLADRLGRCCRAARRSGRSRISSLALSVGATLAVGIGVQLDRALLTSGVFRTGKLRCFGETVFYGTAAPRRSRWHGPGTGG